MIHSNFVKQNLRKNKIGFDIGEILGTCLREKTNVFDVEKYSK